MPKPVRKYRCPGYHACRNEKCRNRCVQRKSEAGKRAADDRWNRVDQNPTMNGARGQQGLLERFRREVRQEAREKGIRLAVEEIERLAKRRLRTHMADIRTRGRAAA